MVSYHSDTLETLEAAIIISVLLSFIKNAIGDDDLPLRKRLTKQVCRRSRTCSNGRFGLARYWGLEYAYV